MYLALIVEFHIHFTRNRWKWCTPLSLVLLLLFILPGSVHLSKNVYICTWYVISAIFYPQADFQPCFWHRVSTKYTFFHWNIKTYLSNHFLFFYSYHTTIEYSLVFMTISIQNSNGVSFIQPLPWQTWDRRYWNMVKTFNLFFGITNNAQSWIYQSINFAWSWKK